MRPARRPWPGVWRRCNWSPRPERGLTVQQVADDIGVHRTIAYRLLSARLRSIRMVAKGEDGRYRSAAALAVLGASFDNNVRQLSAAHTARIGRRTRHHGVAAYRRGRPAGGDRGDRADQRLLSTVLPRGQPIPAGARSGRDRAARQHACRARESVTSFPQARQQGWVITHGEVEPNTYGLAVPVRRRPPSPPTCINLISHREDVVMGGRDAVIKAADELSAILS